jgi:hypothetical protein
MVTQKIKINDHIRTNMVFAMGYIQVNMRKWCTLICDRLRNYLF